MRTCLTVTFSSTLRSSLAMSSTFGNGQTVWVPDPAECFVLAKVTAVKGSEVTATTRSGASVTTKAASAHDPNDEQKQDLVQMANVDTANILNTLRARHKSGHAYTNAGQCGIVISVNPYKWIDICARH